MKNWCKSVFRASELKYLSMALCETRDFFNDFSIVFCCCLKFLRKLAFRFLYFARYFVLMFVSFLQLNQLKSWKNTNTHTTERYWGTVAKKYNETRWLRRKNLWRKIGLNNDFSFSLSYIIEWMPFTHCLAHGTMRARSRFKCRKNLGTIRDERW